MNIDQIFQAVLTAILCGVGAAVWQASLAIRVLGRAFQDHEKLDDERHRMLVYMFQGPMGPMGPMGPTGPTGITGPMGPIPRVA